MSGRLVTLLVSPAILSVVIMDEPGYPTRPIPYDSAAGSDSRLRPVAPITPSGGPTEWWRLRRLVGCAERSPYSALNATIGSTLAALRAGR